MRHARRAGAIAALALGCVWAAATIQCSAIAVRA